MHPVVKTALQSLSLESDRPVFDFGVGRGCLNERVRRMAAAAGLKSFGMHTLRRSFCSNLAAAGVPLQIAQRLMRHSDPKLTAVVYTNAEDILGDAVEKLTRQDGDVAQKSPSVSKR